jgi:hypothetical protein
MMIFSLFALAVVGLGNGSAQAGAEAPSRPQSTVHYPITLDTSTSPAVRQPRPTVSYPIPWDRSGGDR